MAAAVARFWRLDRRLTAAWVVIGALGPLMPLGIAVASGRVVNGAPRVIRQGFDSAAGRRLTGALVVMALLTLASILLDTVRWRLADLLGHRFRADQRRRIMAALLGRAGIEHADDPALQDAAAAADSDWLPPDCPKG